VPGARIVLTLVPSLYAEHETRTMDDREYGKIAGEMGFADATPCTWIAILRRQVRACLAATTGVQDAADVARYLLAGLNDGLASRGRVLRQDSLDRRG
jgi:hypothetical protein